MITYMEMIIYMEPSTDDEIYRTQVLCSRQGRCLNASLTNLLALGMIELNIDESEEVAWGTVDSI